MPLKQLRLARRLIERNYDEPITVDDLSREVALSPYYLIRAFGNAFKQTPHQYLVDVRIARAKELLRNSEMSITDICTAVGYESLGSFSTLFTKSTGISPTTYRDNSQPTETSGYIPLCICLQHNIEEHAIS